MKGLAAVFIHGFMGNPRQFARLSETARAAGAEPHLIALPGHGGDVRAFCGCGRREWAAHVEDVLSGLRGEYAALLLVGHSMGGLLAINAVVKRPAGVAGIVALALPLRLRLTGRAVQMWRSAIRSTKPGEHPRIAAAREMCGVSGIKLRNAAALAPNALGLLRVMREAERALPRLSVPLTAVNSAGDELVSIRSLAALKRRLPGAEAIALRESGHFWYAQNEEAALDRVLTDAVRRCVRENQTGR